MKNKNWSAFEEKCWEYLKETYGTDEVEFIAFGKSSSTDPDINVIINDKLSFSIEVKMPNAQCGQFVLLPNEVAQRFEYSKLNAHPINEDSQAETDNLSKWIV